MQKIRVRSDYHICACCGAALDPGEKYDCNKPKPEKAST